MSGMYIVINVSFCNKTNITEVYPGLKAALDRGSQLAKHAAKLYNQLWIPDPIGFQPKELYSLDNEMNWIFMDNDHEYIAVHFRSLPANSFNAQPRNTLPVAHNDYTLHYYDTYLEASPSLSPSGYDSIYSLNDLIGPTGPTGPTGSFGAKNYPPNDHMSRTLPAGWTYGGKPINMEYLMDFPFEVLPTDHLTGVQKKALVIARIRKMPLFQNYISNIGNFNQKSALDEIAKDSYAGSIIIKEECNFLDGVIDLQRDIKGDSSEDEESSDEESSEDD